MLPINLKCVCGQELEVIPKTLRALADIAKANDWKLLGAVRVGHDKSIAALCPSCAAHENKINQISHAISQGN